MKLTFISDIAGPWSFACARESPTRRSGRASRQVRAPASRSPRLAVPVTVAGPAIAPSSRSSSSVGGQRVHRAGLRFPWASPNQPHPPRSDPPRPLQQTRRVIPRGATLCIAIGFDLADTPAYAMSHGVISMLNVRRTSAVSIDPSGRRSAIRERWIPTAPGDGDLRSRSYPVVSAMLLEEGSLRDSDDTGTDVAVVGRLK